MKLLNGVSVKNYNFTYILIFKLDLQRSDSGMKSNFLVSRMLRFRI